MLFSVRLYCRHLLAEGESLHSCTGPSSSESSQRFSWGTLVLKIGRTYLLVSYLGFGIIRKTIGLWKPIFNTGLDFVCLIKEIWISLLLIAFFKKARSFLLKYGFCCLLKIDRSTFVLLVCCLFIALHFINFFVVGGYNAEIKWKNVLFFFRTNSELEQ